MKRNKRKQRQNEEKPLTLGDLLDNELKEQLKDAKQQLKEVEEKKKREEVERRRKERKEREKNKTFEELLMESDLDWRQFK